MKVIFRVLVSLDILGQFFSCEKLIYQILVLNIKYKVRYFHLED